MRNGSDQAQEIAVLGHRIDRIERKVDFEQVRLDDTIVSLGYEREAREGDAKSLRGSDRSLRKDMDAVIDGIAQIASELGALNTKVAQLEELPKLVERLAKIETTLGRWPQSPDDTGSGVAGRVAQISSSTEIGTLQAPPKASPPEAPTSIPPALVSFWKRHRTLAIVLAVAGSTLAALLENFLRK